MMSAPPWNATRPSVTWMFWAPRRLTSKFSVDSVPKKHGATMVYSVGIKILSLLYYKTGKIHKKALTPALLLPEQSPFYSN